MDKRRILVLNGPNMNMTGIREPDVYGVATLDDINASLAESADTLGIIIDFFQSNHEGTLVDSIQSAPGKYDGIILNAAAYTHYSYAIRDAIASVPSVPVVEVHMSNLAKREEFRHTSVISEVCLGTVSGFGAFSYHLALAALIEELKDD